MVMDHAFVSVAAFFGIEWFDAAPAPDGLTNFYDAALTYLTDPFIGTMRLAAAFLFITISGISSGFSRSNVGRGCQIGLAATAVSAFTASLADRGVLISFGVLHNLCLDILVWAAFEAISGGDRTRRAAFGLGTAALIFAFSIAAAADPSFADGVEKTAFFLVETDDSFYASPGDFFPVIPFSGAFFVGAALSPFIYPERISRLPSLGARWTRPVRFAGRHALPAYLIHVFAIFGLLELLTFLRYGFWVS